MAQKLLIVALAAFLSQGLALPPAASKEVIEIQLPDLSYTLYYQANLVRLYGFARDSQDRQVHCRVTFPDGILYNLWPNFNVPEPTITLPHDGVQRGCYMAIRNPPPIFSGTYELESLVNRPDGSQLLVRRKYHMSFVWLRSGAVVKTDDVSNEEVIVVDPPSDQNMVV